jgi:hypothetical protein
MCSLAAHGLLAGFMCLMHKAHPYGYLLINGRTPTDGELARLVGAQGVAELRRLRRELVDHGVLSVAVDGVLYSRRMVRTAKQSAIGRATGLQGGNPALRPEVPEPKPLSQPLRVAEPKPLAGDDNPHIPEAIFQTPKAPELAEGNLDVSELAGLFLERVPEIYARSRSGAAYHVSRVNMERDLAYCEVLARGWPLLERLDAMYEVFLRRTDIGDKNRPGTPGQFLHMAPDCDRLLRENGL